MFLSHSLTIMYIRTKPTPQTKQVSVPIVASDLNTLNHHEGGESGRQAMGIRLGTKAYELCQDED